jgi:alginate O-acetyltransferase complex protein AlgI
VLFNSLLYLVFLAVAVIGSWLLVRRQALRLAFLLVASCLFYMAWNPVFILLILGSTCWDFTVARLIERTPDVQKVQRRLLLLASVGMNLTLLCYFKYLNFFLQSFDASMRALGWDPAIPVFAIVLPVGISFYTFQTMSYCIDVYRREIPAEKNLLRFALFSTFFPQLVAGPIVRAQVFLPQLHRMPTLSQEDVGEGLFRIARGLAKKVVIADYLAVNLVDRVFSQPHVYSSAEVLVGLYAYTLQIYCDFSGYTDVAIGSARLLGYRLPENFMRPYRARTVAEFWRRWHMTLSSWLRHYVFFPLGGSKGPLWKAQRNTFITLVLIGLWHGANWTFVLYGMLHAFAIMLNRLQNRSRPKGFTHDGAAWWQNGWKIALTFHFVVLARILFRAPSVAAAGDVGRALMTADWGLSRVDKGTWAILVLGYALHWSPPDLIDRVRRQFVGMPAYAQGLALATLAVGMAAVAETDVVPFIYFQF